MSSEGSHSPTQLYIQGFIVSNALPVQPSSLLADNLQQLSAGDHVQVPKISFEPCAFLLLFLCAIDPLQPSHHFGCEIYLRAIQIVGNHLHLGFTADISYLVRSIRVVCYMVN